MRMLVVRLRRRTKREVGGMAGLADQTVFCDGRAFEARSDVTACCKLAFTAPLLAAALCSLCI